MIRKKEYPMPKKIEFNQGIITYLNNMYKNCRNIQHNEIYFDFTVTKVIDKNIIAVLGLIFNKIKSQHNDVFLRFRDNNRIKEIFKSVGFVSSGDTDVILQPNYISYKSFNADDKDEFRKYFLNEIKDINDKDVINYILAHIMEIFLNVKTHARLDSNRGKYGNKEVFCSGYYDKNEEFLSFSIVNNGITFKQNISKRKNIDYIFEHEYIKWATRAVNSTTKNRPGGAGLAMVEDLITKSSGMIGICSGKGYYELTVDKYNKKNIKIEDLLSDFPGTIVIIRIPLSYVDNMRIVESDDELSINDILSED